MATETKLKFPLEIYSEEPYFHVKDGRDVTLICASELIEAERQVIHELVRLANAAADLERERDEARELLKSVAAHAKLCVEVGENGDPLQFDFGMVNLYGEYGTRMLRLIEEIRMGVPVYRAVKVV